MGTVAACSLVGRTEVFGGTNGTNKKPNVVLIFVDDLGYADVGYQGCKDVPTPNIDSIASSGAQFSAAYVTAPVCGPSRAGMLTGHYQQRFGFEDNPGPFRQTPDTKIGYPRTEKLIGEHMKSLGYRTAFIGKHHSGQKPENNPVNRGSDFFFGFDDGSSTYFVGNGRGALKRGLESIRTEKEYLTDAFGREAVSFIERNKDVPFFLYVPFNAVHAPMQAPDELLKKFEHIEDSGRRKLAAMLYSLDRNIGRIIGKLRSCDLEENTLVIFISDNGGAEETSNYSGNLPCRDIKGSMYDGGIRIPFCVQWKGVIPPGQTLDSPINTLDVLPTVISAAKGKIQKSWKLDGVNLLPYLTKGQKQLSDRYLYWRFLHGWAIRDNTWKLVKPWGGRDWDANRKPELYRIASDIGEKKNVINEYPDVAERLQKAWDSWSSTLMQPQWGWQEGLCGNYKVAL